MSLLQHDGLQVQSKGERDPWDESIERNLSLNSQDEDAFAGTLLGLLSRILPSNPLLKAKTPEGKIYGHIGVQVS
jgi:hypothetical protein